MPDFDGFDLARQLRVRSETSAAKIVALSGFGGPEVAAAAKSAGFDLYIQKPATAEQLLKILADSLTTDGGGEVGA